jgi:rubrerythrin
MKELFTKLRDWEETHIEKFTEIRNKVREPEATDAYPGELNDYIKAFVDDRLYNEVSPSSFSKNVKSALSAVQYGIGFEKDAILFFREVLTFMGTADRDTIQELIDEEKQHLIYLVGLKDKLKK